MIGTSKMRLRPLAVVHSKVVVLLLLIRCWLLLPLWDYVMVIFCYVLLRVHSCFAVILMGKRDLVALLCLSSWCLVIVVWLFLTMPLVCLQCVVFPDYTHLLFLPTRLKQY